MFGPKSTKVIMQWPYNRGGLSWGGQFSSILLPPSIWNLVRIGFWRLWPLLRGTIFTTSEHLKSDLIIMMAFDASGLIRGRLLYYNYDKSSALIFLIFTAAIILWKRLSMKIWFLYGILLHYYYDFKTI